MKSWGCDLGINLQDTWRGEDLQLACLFPRLEYPVGAGVVRWNRAVSRERELRRKRFVGSSRDEVLYYRARDEPGGLDLEDWRERLRSAGHLPAFLTVVVSGFPGSARLNWGMSLRKWAEGG